VSKIFLRNFLRKHESSFFFTALFFIGIFTIWLPSIRTPGNVFRTWKPAFLGEVGSCIYLGHRNVLDGREISLKKKQLGYELMSYLGFFLMLRGFVLASILCFFSQNKTFFFSKTTRNALEKS